MQYVWQSLLWKEWHEHKWKLLSLVAIVMGVPLCVLYKGPDYLFGAITWTLIAYAFLATLFIGMGTAAGENANKTMPFLQALPVPMWKAAAAKLLGASVTLVTPIVLIVGLAYLGYQVGSWLDQNTWRSLELSIGRDLLNLRGVGPDIGGWCVSRLAGGILAALSLLVWVVAAGVNRRDEIRAGAIAVLVFVGVWFLVSYVGKWETEITGSNRPGPVMQMTASSAPAGRLWLVGMYYDNKHFWNDNALPGWTLALTACVSHTCLILWFLLRFGRTPSVSRQSRRATLVTDPQTLWLAPPRRSRLTAVLWKQLRETGPFVLLGVAAIVGSSTLIFQRIENPGPRGEFADIFLGIGAYLGFFIVIVAGIGVMLDDLKPGLHTFWRSRPINPDLWFWVKFFTGLAVTALSLGIPLLLVLWFGRTYWVDSIGRGDRGPLIMTSALFLSTYCFAVVAMALVRRPLYAAIFSIGLIGICFATIEYLLPDSFEFHPGAVFVWALVLSVIATIAAWLAVRYDIGYKG